MNELEKNLIETNDEEEISKIVNIFNSNIQKREQIRKNKLSELQDAVLDQMARRIEQRGDNFDNQDLLQYYKVINDSLSKKTELEMETPKIQINQQFNVNTVEFDRNSRQRIIDAVNAIIEGSSEAEGIIEQLKDVQQPE